VVFVIGGFAGGGPVVELHADLFHGAEGAVAEQEGGDEGGYQGKSHEGERLFEPRLIDGAQQRGADADVDGGKGLAVAVERMTTSKTLEDRRLQTPVQRDWRRGAGSG